jgi:hypothetical protein
MKSMWLVRLSFALILAFCLMPTFTRTARAAMPDTGSQTYYLFVFENPVPGRDAEYYDWLETQHVSDMLSVPGFVEAQRMAYSDAQMTAESQRERREPRNIEFIARAKRPTRYCVMYKIVTNNIASVYNEVRRREKTQAIKISQASDPGSEYSYTFRVIAPMIEGKIPPDTGVPPESFYVFVFNTPLPGREDEYNKWYNEEHGPGIVHRPSPVPGTGYASGQRMVLDDVQLDAQPVISKYLVLYKLITPNVQTVFRTGQQSFEQSIGKPQPPKNFPYDETTDFNLTYRLTGPAVEPKGRSN